MAKDAVCFVPSKALLALFKVKARRDRLYDIRTKGATMNPARLAWLRGKVAKDGSDIIALLDPKERGAILEDEMDYAQVSALASGFGIRDLVRGALEQDSLGLSGPYESIPGSKKRSETHRPHHPIPVDSSIFRRGSTNETCHFCVHEVDNDRRFLCLAYECFVLLDTVCDSYERRV